MSTNYEWLPGGFSGEHISKVVSVPGLTAGVLARRFIWAADPVRTMYLLMYLLGQYSEWKAVKDEYGKEITAGEMITLIVGCVDQDYNSVGQEFS